MKRVLLTGATGFIGRQTLLPLEEAGYEVHATYRHTPTIEAPSVIWHEADILDETSVAALCKKIRPTHLMHLAWYVNPADYKNSPKNEVWKQASLALLRTFQENGGERALMAGSNGEYDWNAGVDPLQEHTSTLTSANEYAKAKNETRIAATKFANDTSLSLAWTRTFHLYGPHEAPARLVPKIIEMLHKDERPILDVKNPTLDFSYVKDVAGAYVALLESPVQGVVNIGSGQPITIFSMARQIAEMLGKIELIDKEPEKSALHVVADVARLKNEVGWHPKYDLRAGLEETIAWWRENI